MKILFKNTTKYDKENYNNFIKFHSEKYGKRIIIKKILTILLVLYLMLFNIIYGNWVVLIAILLAGVFVYLISKMKLEEEKKKKKNKIREFTFYFYQRYIKIKHKRKFQRINYFEFKKIFETNDNFFLYVEDDKALILDKDGFEVGTAKEFAEFIKKKCPFKYSNNYTK